MANGNWPMAIGHGHGHGPMMAIVQTESYTQKNRQKNRQKEGEVDQDQSLWTSLRVHLGFSALIILAMIADQLFVASMLVLVAFGSRLYAMRQYRSMIFGALAIFLYVGGEVSIGSWLVNYFAEEAIGGLDETVAGQMLGLYWGAAFIGRIGP